MNKIIEEFLDSGFIDKEAALRLDDFDTMIKESGLLDIIKDNLLQVAKTVGPTAVGSAVGIFGADLLATRAMEKKKQEQLANIHSSFATIMQKNPEFSEQRELVQSRFNEIAHFSPSIAGIPDVAERVLKKHLGTGLDEAAISNLTQIEVANREINKVVKPSTAGSRFVESVVPGAVKGIGEGLIELQSNPELRMSPLDSGTNIAKAFMMLQRRGLVPDQLKKLNIENPKDQMKLVEFGRANPSFLKETILKNNLVDEYNSMVKKASVDVEELSLEKKAQLLADQYTLIKIAKLPPALLGLGAAALFGAASSLAEEGADFARTRKMNETISNSWKETSNRLRGLSEQESSLAGMVDYRDKEVQRKSEEAFKVLRDIAPSLAANSTIATSFVNNVVQNEGVITPEVIKMLSETQKNINTSREYTSPFASSPLSKGFGSGFNAAGGKESIRELVKGIG